MSDPDPFEPIQDNPALPRVLLIGDSISIGYTLPVRELLDGRANLHRPGQNCRATIHALELIDTWLGDSSWDIIHFNFGLHDIAMLDAQGERSSEGARQVPVDQYTQYLNALVDRLQQTGASLIWCCTTPVPEGAERRKKGDDILYNAAAGNIMRARSIPINDLYTYALQRLDDIQKPANVHFTPEGSAELAKAVADHILEALSV
jgi:hypothetical protein